MIRFIHAADAHIDFETEHDPNSGKLYATI
jgi:DNA repair exonuclease SbcCD nuclease subunit